MEKPLRILIVLNLPWDPRLGAARVLIELSEQWRRAGNEIDKFCLTDAFPRSTRSRRLEVLRQVLFARRALSYVRRNADRFDVIDALIGSLPYSKRRLGFRGLLVGRSIGLYLAYEEFIRFSRKRWRDQPRGNVLGSIFYRFIEMWTHWNSDRSVRHCDLINLPIDQEQKFLSTGKSIVVHPYGLSGPERAAFAGAAQPIKVRVTRKEVCFLGMWSVRKGSRDWPEIIRRIRELMPEVRFSFLGTMTDEQTIMNDLKIARGEVVRCLTSYDPKQLPELIAGCAVGLFPSYIEGFGLSVVEQLASGIPTIAYDVPGPRQIFGSNHADFLVPAGDAVAMADRALQILRMNEYDYNALSVKSRQIAEKFRWEQIAADTINQYRAAFDLPRSTTHAQAAQAVSS